jgi:hypothetical protein
MSGASLAARKRSIMREWYALCILLVVVLVIVVTHYARIAEHNSAAVQTTLETQLRLLPTLPGAQIRSQHASHKLDSVLVENTYSLLLPYSAIRDFYAAELGKRGWEIAREHRIKDYGRDLGGREIDFCNGLYGASLMFAGAHPDYGWTYALSLSWGPELSSRNCTDKTNSHELTQTDKMLQLLFHQPSHYQQF